MLAVLTAVHTLYESDPDLYVEDCWGAGGWILM